MIVNIIPYACLAAEIGSFFFSLDFFGSSKETNRSDPSI
jgi:hypothetical protein